MSLPELIRWGMTHDREAVLIPLAFPAFIAVLCGAAALIQGGR